MEARALTTPSAMATVLIVSGSAAPTVKHETAQQAPAWSKADVAVLRIETSSDIATSAPARVTLEPSGIRPDAFPKSRVGITTSDRIQPRLASA